MAKLTTEEFIQRAREAHGDKYDYSNVEYVNCKTKVCIICPEHGEFMQNPFSHMKGCGCAKCGRITCGEKQQQWTKDACYEVAFSCKTVEEFRDRFPGAYVVSCKRGWRKDYVWLSTKQVPNGYWNNYNLCKDAALKCKNVSEFRNRFSNAHMYSVKNGWIDEFFPNRQRKIHWTDELAMTEAKKYTTKIEFKNNNRQAYEYICKHDLMKYCTWFKPHVKDNISLIKDYINRCSIKYNNFYDYSQIDINNVKNTSYFKVSIICPEHGVFYQTLWSHLNSICPCPLCRKGIHSKNNTNKIKTIIQDRIEHGIIYSYINKKNGKRYIGQTINPKRRKRDHLRQDQKYKTTFDKILQKEGIENFNYEILFEVDELRSKIFDILNEKEKEYIKFYNCQMPNGYNISAGGKSVKWMVGYKPTEETLQKLRDSHKGKLNSMKGKHYAEDKKNEIVSKHKKTMQQKYDNGYIAQRKDIMLFKNGIHIGTYPNAKEIERNFGIDYKRIHNALKSKCTLDEEYIFMYKEEYSKELLNEISNNPSIHKKETKMVKQMDMQGNLVDILKLSEATKKFGKHVSDVCNGKRKNCKGYNFEWLLTK